jgi:serine protease Do
MNRVFRKSGSSVLFGLTLLFAGQMPVTEVQAQVTTPTDVAESQTLSDVIDSRHQVVVKLFGAGVGNLDSYGSGVIISEQGHVLTVWNHLINTGYLTAVTSEGRRYDVKVTGTSAAHDVAILKLQSRDDEVFPFISPDTFSDADTGDSVLAFSNMFHVATGNEPVSVVHGVISVRTPLEANQGRWVFPMRTEVLLIDAITNNSGAAGGLLTLDDGTPVGLIGREIRHKVSNTWVNYAVPLSTLKPVVLNLLAGKKVESAPTDTEDQAMISDQLLTSRFGITMLPNVVERTPAYVDAVVPGSIASTSGLRRGDLIVLVDDAIITCITDFQKQMATRRSGSRLALTVNRNQQLETVTFKVP